LGYVLKLFYDAVRNTKVQLYLLGDRMQQIYKNYDGSFEEELIMLNESISLDTNHRSVKAVIDILNNIYNNPVYKQNVSKDNEGKVPDYLPEVIITSDIIGTVERKQTEYNDTLVLYLLNNDKFKEIGASALYRAYSRMDKYSFLKKYHSNDVLSNNTQENPDPLMRFMFSFDSIMTLYKNKNFGSIITQCKLYKEFYSSTTYSITKHKIIVISGGKSMKYLVIGAGGTGGSIGAFMTDAGKDVTVIARGKHLEAIQNNGLKMEPTVKGNYTVFPMKAWDMDHYDEQPDVIFNCVKGYSLDDTITFIKRFAHKDTIVIPILNIYGTGSRMQEHLPGLLVTDGCIYIAAEIKEPGTILQRGDIFRVIYGVRKPEEYRPVLEQVAEDLKDSGITTILSDNIRRDALQKFSFVSPMAACGVYYDIDTGGAQQEGTARDTFIALMREIDALAQAMEIQFAVDIVETNLKILDNLSPTASSSMQRDVKQGKNSEMDGLIFEVVRLGRQYGVDTPTYEMIAEKLGFKA